MKLKLAITTKYVDSVSGSGEEFVFSVLDFDKAKSYPLNFVCILPKNLNVKSGSLKSEFYRVYGENGNQVATKLLTSALKSEDNFEFKEEIAKRLKALEPKPSAKCAVCGCVFEPRRFGHFLQKICAKCRNKGEPLH